MAQNARSYQRFATELRGRLAGARVTTANLSMSGAQLVCPALSYSLAARRLADGSGRLELDLGQEGPLGTEVRIAYVSEVDDEYLIGVAFASLDDDARGRLERYVARVAGPEFARPSRPG